jgi:hypothetical protein
MAANILRSNRAVQMSVFIVRAFVRMRERLAATRDLEKRLAEIDKTLISHDVALRDLFNKIKPLLLPQENKPNRQIGFITK